jgi:Na+-transporting NADH:ubiquinone oxidoreductase subunit NqrB
MMTFQSSIHKSFSDPRWLQVYLLANFLLYGIVFLGWNENGFVYGAAILSCLATQSFWARLKGLPKGSWKSALISALGLCLLLKVNSWEWMFLAGALTISSKFLIHHKHKHIFNPTNFGIMVLLMLNVGWISPGQWGSGEAIFGLFISGACLVLFGIKRWDVALTFILTLFALEAIRSVGYLGWGWDVVFHKFNSGTILLFAFFMITDPKTSPNSRRGRVIWGMLIALLSFALSQFFYFYQAPLIALFMVSLTTPFLDKIFQSARFYWNYQLKI